MGDLYSESLQSGGRFVDRGSESDALARALQQHRIRMEDGEKIDRMSLRNVLTFYGEGGVGKTELSRRLASWIGGRSAGLEHWGAAPTPRADVIVRWDLNDSRGGLDPLSLLSTLRSQLGLVKPSWPAFDIAFAAFHQALRPGVDLRLRTPRSGTTTLLEVLAGLTSDAATAAGVVVAGGVGATAFGAGRSLVVAAHQKSRAWKALRRHPGLEQLVVDCESLSGATEEAAELAGRLASMLTEEIDLMDVERRPLVVVFVDHMERLQTPGQRHLGEATLNRLVSRLPYALFVITGRNCLRWHEHTDLPVSGGHRWPLLPTDIDHHDEPHQHLIGNLSTPDAEEFLGSSFDALGIAVGPGLVEELAHYTDGWPLHLQMIVGVAQERSADGRPLTAQDLGGSLPALVERLLSDLPAEVADAFRAACLLPYFDVEFVAAAGDLHAGAVEQLLRRNIVRPNEGSAYPYRIHDTLRSMVRETGSKAVGGWGASDWEHHAARAMAEAHRRFNAAMEAGDDRAAIDSLALGLNVAVENDVFDEWLVVAIRRSPTMKGLAPLIAAQPADSTPPDLADVLEFLVLRTTARSVDETDALQSLVERRTAISSSAALWRAYDLRARGRIEEALAQFDVLIRDFGGRTAVYNNQYIATLRMDRRFADALELEHRLDDSQRLALRSGIDRSHARYGGASAEYENRVRTTTSRRYAVELRGDWLVARHREGGVTPAEARDVRDLAVLVGHSYAQAVSAGVLAEMCMFDDALFAECNDELAELSSRHFQPYRAWPGALALRAWATGDDGLARRAREIAARATYRTAAWIPTEILLEQLGYPLDPQPAQWLEPYDVVRERWLALLERVVERARASR